MCYLETRDFHISSVNTMRYERTDGRVWWAVGTHELQGSVCPSSYWALGFTGLQCQLRRLDEMSWEVPSALFRWVPRGGPGWPKDKQRAGGRQLHCPPFNRKAGGQTVLSCGFVCSWPVEPSLFSLTFIILHFGKCLVIPGAGSPDMLLNITQIVGAESHSD